MNKARVFMDYITELANGDNAEIMIKTFNDDTINVESKNVSVFTDLAEQINLLTLKDVIINDDTTVETMRLNPEAIVYIAAADNVVFDDDDEDDEDDDEEDIV